MKQTKETLRSFLNPWRAHSDSTGHHSGLPAAKRPHGTGKDTKGSDRDVARTGQAASERTAGAEPSPWSRGDG